MKKVDYIIVGNGYAALFFAHQLLMNNKSFVVFSDDNSRSASSVSAGMINPVVLKKFTTFWLAKEQIDYLDNVMTEISTYLGMNYLIKEEVHRIFHDENEQKLWLKKRQNQDLQDFLDEQLVDFPLINNPFSSGKVNHSSRLNVTDFFIYFFKFLDNNSFLISEKFDYNLVNIDNSSYKNLEFKNIVFCEGIGVEENPYFNTIPVIPNKGHHIKVKLSKPLPFKSTVKKKHFLFPLHNDLHFYGGTYDRENLSNEIDDSAIDQLRIGLNEFYPFDFDIAEVHYGFRPTVKDRRPILGVHPNVTNFYVFNGLGARGILNGCYFSKTLFNFIESGIEIPLEVDIKRFY